MTNIPDLFSTLPQYKAAQFYQLYLLRLNQHSRWPPMVNACRQIRAYASRRGRPRRAGFTYHFEIDALCQLRKYPVAWRLLRRWERLGYTRNINLNAKKWRSDELDWFIRFHSPLLYFLGRYRLARRLLEAALAKRFRPSQNDSSYELLPYLYNGTGKPRQRQHVTLFHIYAALGKSLLEWPEWRRFVDGLHPKLLRLAKVDKEALLRDPRLLRNLDEAMHAELKRRLTAGVSDGQRDLTDPPGKVRRRQRAVAKKIGNVQQASFQQREKLENIFPELKAMAKQRLR